MKQARSTVWVTALTYAKVVSQPLELWEKWWNWRIASATTRLADIPKDLKSMVNGCVYISNTLA